jgi:hypothetical protein
MPRQRGPVYQLEGVPPDLWRRAKARAALEGQSIRGVFLAFLQEYAAGTLTAKPEHIAQLSADARRESPAEAPMTERVESPSPTHVSSVPDVDLGF